jgi:bifunctional UDP-N-acetylglucosamine pyrophosphorylase/glucosamine-1-phosphate N-acetyltransferase
MSYLDGSTAGCGVRIGPFARLRPGCVIGDRSKIGNFVELKNAQVGEAVAASHLSYLGDTEIGSHTNIGAGTITCNYDGFVKHRTVIGEGAFIGTNNALIAPIRVGDGAITAAGSTLTEDVPDNALAIARARQQNREGWAIRWREARSKRREKNG